MYGRIWKVRECEHHTLERQTVMLTVAIHCFSTVQFWIESTVRWFGVQSERSACSEKVGDN